MIEIVVLLVAVVLPVVIGYINQLAIPARHKEKSDE